ncbi:hypothetical protein Pint_28418 [Pistacia integerrima]|uniref:Uncharacterized protein n=1 Tax=Pistacia integerrima TaxID=434235 RepID=A0ACC0YSE4_9ROSI|nr:hypothetical protein Pint_28418 [Pistacia integerrima]
MRIEKYFKGDEEMIIDAIEQVGGIYVITADHGNTEDMVKRNKSGEPALDKDGQDSKDAFMASTVNW